MTDDEIREKMKETYYDGGVSWNQIHELGYQRPSIEKFLNFSEKYQKVPFRAIHNFGGLEFVDAHESQFALIGISGGTLASCMDGDPDAIRLVCRRILVSLETARELVERGESHLASRGAVINPTAVKAFILAALDAKERYQETDVIPELFFLLSQVLLPGVTDAMKREKSQNMKSWVLLLAWAYHFKHGSFASFRKLAGMIGVAPTTISRMFEGEDDYQKQALKASYFEKDASKHPALSKIYDRL